MCSAHVQTCSLAQHIMHPKWPFLWFGDSKGSRHSTLMANKVPLSCLKLPHKPRVPHVSLMVYPHFLPPLSPFSPSSPSISVPLPLLPSMYRVPYLLFTTQNSIRRLFLNGSTVSQTLVGPVAGQIRKVDYHYGLVCIFL